MNKLLNFNQIRQITGGRWLSPPDNPLEELSGAAFDTRALENAQIFFAWKGESGDGHQYLPGIADSKIKLAIVEQEVAPIGNIAVLKVSESLKALRVMAKELTSHFNGKIISLTGSSGKTTAKTWLRYILSSRYRVLSNPGSFNNHIGCPVSILGMKKHHDLLVLEMGASGPGEIKLLASLAPADISLLLNVGHAHLGKFGGLENTYLAKTEIFSNQRKNARSLIPYSDSRLKKILGKKERVYFGTGSPCFNWELLEIDAENKEQRILFHTPYGSRDAVVNQMGKHVGELLSAVIAVCWRLGLSWDDISDKLGSLPMEKGRSSFLRGTGGELILDDTYNANPESVINMLETICSLKADRYAGVVGNMAELEEDLSESAEFLLSRLPEKLTDLVLSGDTGKIIFPLAQKRFPELNVRYLESTAEIIRELKSMSDKNTVIGVKGSRSSHMERVIYGLSGQEGKCELNKCGKLSACRDCEEF